ncbi:hypothetical protein PO909_007127 [Leuciscus waleckii]
MWDVAGDMIGLSASLSSSAFHLQHSHASFRRHTDTLQRPWGTRRISGSLLWSWWLFYRKSVDYPIPRIECTSRGVPRCWIHYPRVPLQPIWDTRAWRQ